MIVDLLEQKISQRNVAIQFDVSKTTVVNIGRNKDVILKIWNDNCHADRKRKLRKTEFEVVNLGVLKQPVDQDIIKAVKDRYRSRLLEYIVSKAENCQSREEFHKSVTVLHAVRWLYGAWMDISQKAIEKYFCRAGFVSSRLANDIEEQETILTDSARELSDDLVAELAPEREIEKADKFLPVHEELPDDIDRALNNYLFNRDDNDGGTESEKETDDEEGKKQRKITWVLTTH
ncbi:hypothetical protein KQX54_000947 [Cotesia glomerata]|uniref:DDE-1 domain-containing protein n=1 Tax=Cotesia glomerata TaxID=32391 RepID=A0AAV7IS53_COTGL|nr:hypothetical protein KQX54_000947 [Cotesia glomerata]